MSIPVQMFLHNRPHFSLSIPICVLQKPQVYLSILLTRNQESSSFILGFGTKSRHSEPFSHSASFFWFGKWIGFLSLSHSINLWYFWFLDTTHKWECSLYPLVWFLDAIHNLNALYTFFFSLQQAFWIWQGKLLDWIWVRCMVLINSWTWWR